MSNNANIVIAQALMMRIKDYVERSLDKKDVTLDVAMAEIRYTVDAYDEYIQILLFIPTELLELIGDN